MQRKSDDFWNHVSREALGRFLSNLIHKVTRLHVEHVRHDFDSNWPSS